MKHRDGSAPDGVAQAACANDVVAVLMPSTDLGGSRPAREAPPEMVRGDGASRTPRAIDAWWFADAVVVVASAAEERTRREYLADKSKDVSNDGKDRSRNRNRTTGTRERVTDGRVDAASAAQGRQRPARRSAVLVVGQAFAKSPLAEDSLAAAATAARQLGPLGADSAFVIVQDCESAREARDARGCLVRAGLAEANVFCLEKSLDQEVEGGGGGDGGMGASFREWRAAWGRDRARRVARDYAPVRDCVRFWGSFGTVGDDGGDVGGEALKEAASASESDSESESMGDRVDAAARAARAALEAAHAEASLASLGSFLRTALEGLPRLGVGGAFDRSRAYAQLHVAFVCSQGIRSRRARDVPVRIVRVRVRRGIFPVLDRPRPARRARRALHEQVSNGIGNFDMVFLFYCALLRRGGIAVGSESRRGGVGGVRRGGWIARARRDARDERTEGGGAQARGTRARAAAEEERERKAEEERRGNDGERRRGDEDGRRSRELAGARMDAAVCKSLVDSTSELRRRAMRAMRSVTDAGVDALREAEAAAVDAAREVRDSAKTGRKRKRSKRPRKRSGAGPHGPS